MLVEFLKPGGVELARRWLAALASVDPDQREAVVASVEARIAEVYGSSRAEGAVTFDVVQPPVQREGYVEQQVTTYEQVEPKPRRAGCGGQSAA